MPTKKRKKSPAQRIAAGIAYVAFLCFFLALGTAAGWVSQSKVLSSAVTGFFKKPEDVFHQDNLVILVLGCDEDRATGGKKVLKSGVRSDMMLLTKIDFKNNKITGVSIPRDTLCEIEGYKKQKINAYHAIGGRPLAKQAVESLLGVKIDRVVDLDFQAFEDLVDMVGGVPVTVDKNLHYTDRAGGLYIDLKKGYQVLNGYKAMGFVRFRHSDSDFARQDRQHQFILALKEVLQKKKSLIGQVADQAVKVAGNEFTPEEAAKLGQFAKDIKEKDIKLGSIAVTEPNPNPHYYEIVDDDKLEPTLREYNFLPPLPGTQTTNQ